MKSLTGCLYNISNFMFIQTSFFKINCTDQYRYPIVLSKQMLFHKHWRSSARSRKEPVYGKKYTQVNVIAYFHIYQHD